MIGGLLQPAADIPGRTFYERYGNIEGCSIASQFSDVWVFNPRGWNRTDVLGKSAAKYENLNDSEILPTRIGFKTGPGPYAFEEDQPQNFGDFRLSDTPGGNFHLTINTAWEEGWACSGVQGKWCRKPYLPRPLKGPETVILCFEYSHGTEIFEPEFFNEKNERKTGPGFEIPKRPRACTMDETANDDNNCICYLINISGQSGYKNQEGGSAFRPEVLYLEIRRADGTYGSDRSFYKNSISENCPSSSKVYSQDADLLESDKEGPVSDFNQCKPCESALCNRVWEKKNLRNRWHEAGRIRYPRMG